MVKWYYPKSVENVIELLKLQEELIPFAGGTDLMVQCRTYAGIQPEFDAPVMYLGNIGELSFIKGETDKIEIGATTTLTDILKCNIVPKVLKDAVSQIASPSIRNMATIGGNVCNGSPAGDTLPPLYTLNAEINIIAPDCDKTIPIHMFLRGPKQIFLLYNEIVSSISFDNLSNYTYYYKKVGTRKANSLSKLSVSVVGLFEENILKDIRIAAGAVAPTVVRVKNLEQIMISKTKQQVISMLPEILEKYSEFIKPIDDQRSNAIYRKTITLNLIKQGILSILGEV
jgi:CO/xanthine dehydrogenase FAD-binding subunit